VSIPLLVIPIVIWVLAKSVSGLSAANIVLIVLGIIGMSIRRILMNKIALKYVERKYKMLAGFKEVNN